jgi:ribonuclease VapC
MSVVLDSSAVLSVLWEEPGNTYVLEHIDGACMSAVNYAEVLTKIADRGVEKRTAMHLLDGLAIDIIAFDKTQSEAVGDLRLPTLSLGLSVGDRACLALALAKQSNVLTADRAWQTLELEIDVQLIR